MCAGITEIGAINTQVQRLISLGDIITGLARIIGQVQNVRGTCLINQIRDLKRGRNWISR